MFIPSLHFASTGFEISGDESKNQGNGISACQETVGTMCSEEIDLFTTVISGSDTALIIPNHFTHRYLSKVLPEAVRKFLDRQSMRVS